MSSTTLSPSSSLLVQVTDLLFPGMQAHTGEVRVWKLALLALALWIVWNAISVFRFTRLVRDHPGHRDLLCSATLPAQVLPKTKYLNEAAGAIWFGRRKIYESKGHSIVTAVSVFGPRHVSFRCSNPASVKTLNADRKRFRKPVESYKILNIFGNNVVTTEGEEWRKHRKIAAPGFSEAVFKLVWNTTTQIFFEMMEDQGWDKIKAGEEVRVDDVPHLILRMALAVLTTASFGGPLQWKLDTKSVHGAGRQMSFVESIIGASENLIWLIVFPKFLFKLPIKKLRQIQLYATELEAHMRSMIRMRREELNRGEVSVKHDLFNALVTASIGDESMGEKGDGGLTDEELVGNTFIFALAGHETSAHSLSFALAYLALRPDIQDWLYEEVAQVFDEDHEPTIDDFSNLPRVMAAFYETLRLFPPVTLIPKRANEDTFLQDDPAPRPSEVVGETLNGEKRQVFIPKDSYVDIDVAGLPGEWKDPEEFKPSRFLEPYNKDAFVPFSAGARGCIGRRFAEDGKPETPEETRKRLLAAKPGITLTPVDVNLMFKRRDVVSVRRPIWDE